MLNVLFFGNCLVVSKRFHTFLRQAKRQSRAAPSKKKQIQPNKYLFIFGQVVGNVYLCGRLNTWLIRLHWQSLLLG